MLHFSYRFFQMAGGWGGGCGGGGLNVCRCIGGGHKVRQKQYRMDTVLQNEKWIRYCKLLSPLGNHAVFCLMLPLPHVRFYFPMRHCIRSVFLKMIEYLITLQDWSQHRFMSWKGPRWSDACQWQNTSTIMIIVFTKLNNRKAHKSAAMSIEYGTKIFCVLLMLYPIHNEGTH